MVYKFPAYFDCFCFWVVGQCIFVVLVNQLKNSKQMQKSNVETIINELAKANAEAYPESYPFHTEGYSEPCTQIESLAKAYFDNRTESEIERDEAAGVTLEDYTAWCNQGVNEALNPDAE